MKRKIMAMCLVIAMAATAIIGGTLAYFTDTDSAKNVMVTGNVKIYQNEQQRTIGDELDNDAQHQSIRKEGDGFEDFEDNKKLYPITKEFKYDKNVTIIDGQRARPMADNDYNVVDKIVTVTNEGTEKAYARTLFAFEMLAIKGDDGQVTYDYAMNGMNGPLVINTVLDIYGSGMTPVVNDNGEWVTFDLTKDNGETVRYAVCEYYHGELASGETSVPSLLQMYLKSDVNNDFYDQVGNEYEILTLSQATQTAGFTDCKQALDQAFGKVADADLVEWFKDVK